MIGNYAYDKKAKPVGITVKSMKSSSKSEQWGYLVPTLNDFREEGVKISVKWCVHTKCCPFYPTNQQPLPRGFP